MASTGFKSRNSKKVNVNYKIKRDSTLEEQLGV